METPGIPTELFEIFLHKVGGTDPDNAYTGTPDELMQEVHAWHRQEVLKVLDTIHQRSEEDILELVDELRKEYDHE